MDKDQEGLNRRGSIILKLAAVTLVIACLGYILYYTSNPDLSAFYYENYEAYPNVIEPVPVTGSSENSHSVYTLYEQRHYEDALLFFQNVTPKNDTTLFYEAQCQMALNQNENALRNLQLITDRSPFYEPAQWYECLIYLKTTKKDELSKKLEQIIEAESGYSKRAKKLKESL